MKKTLIALMALAGVASANWSDYVNTKLAEAITTTQYQDGDAYTLNFTVTATSFNGYVSDSILTLGQSYYLMSQAGSYVGLSADNDSLSNGSSDPGPNKSGIVDSDNKMHTITSDTLVYGWVSLSQSQGSAANGVANMAITLSYDGADTTFVLDFDGANEYDTTIVYTAQQLKASDIVIGGRIEGTSVVTFQTNGQTVLIPEPATATLSLLALCGLAARRRRK